MSGYDTICGVGSAIPTKRPRADINACIISVNGNAEANLIRIDT